MKQDSKMTEICRTQIMAIRETGLTNMIDVATVRELAYMLEFKEQSSSY